jgi:adenylate cyclase
VGVLDDLVAALGISEAAAAEARRNGTLVALVSEHFLLPGGRKHDLTAVAELADISVADATRLWRALGLPQQVDDEPVFTDADVEALRLFVRTMPRMSDYVVHEARVISGAMARIAEVMVDEVWDQHFATGGESADSLEELAGSDIDMARVEQLLLHLLRRQLVASIYRRATLNQQPAGPVQAVGFADLVGFTALSQRLASTELAQLVVSFEEVTHDLVSDAGGRVVKTIGDEIMFSCPEPLAAARLALALASTRPSGLPGLRVAAAWGPVLVREGDCFGPTVNLAARLVGAADPGTALVSDDLRTMLDASINVVSAGTADLKDLGPVPLWKLVATSVT